MTSALVIARKELLDLRRNRFLLAILGFVLVAVVISVVVSATQFGAKLDAYNAYLDALRAAGNTTTPAAPQLFPLQLLRGSIEYLEILGALFAIVMGYGMIAKEKQRATLQLIYSRPDRPLLPAGGQAPRPRGRLADRRRRHLRRGHRDRRDRRARAVRRSSTSSGS